MCVTGPDPAWLAQIAARLVGDRLCACGQVTSPIRSVYRWRGEIVDETEARVALHTRRVLVPAVIGVVTESHPYELPGIIVLPIVDATPAYAQWIRDETTAPTDPGPTDPTPTDPAPIDNPGLDN